MIVEVISDENYTGVISNPNESLKLILDEIIKNDNNLTFKAIGMVGDGDNNPTVNINVEKVNEDYHLKIT